MNTIAAAVCWLLVHGFGVAALLATNLPETIQNGWWFVCKDLAVIMIIHTLTYIYLITRRFKEASKHGNCNQQGLLQLMPSVAVQPDQCKPAASCCADYQFNSRLSQHELKWHCRRCNTWRPARARHCKSCKICINGFDHHCGLLQICVGSHNHGAFWLYLSMQTLVCICALHHALTAIRYRVQSQGDGCMILASVMVALCIFLVSLVVGALLCFHTYLISANWKSCEILPVLHCVVQLQQVHQQSCHQQTGVMQRSMFSKGVLKNWYHFVFDRSLYDSVADNQQASSINTWFDNELYSCC